MQVAGYQVLFKNFPQCLENGIGRKTGWIYVFSGCIRVFQWQNEKPVGNVSDWFSIVVKNFSLVLGI